MADVNTQIRVEVKKEDLEALSKAISESVGKGGKASIANLVAELNKMSTMLSKAGGQAATGPDFWKSLAPGLQNAAAGFSAVSKEIQKTNNVSKTSAKKVQDIVKAYSDTGVAAASSSKKQVDATTIVERAQAKLSALITKLSTLNVNQRVKDELKAMNTAVSNAQKTATEAAKSSSKKVRDHALASAQIMSGEVKAFSAIVNNYARTRAASAGAASSRVKDAISTSAAIIRQELRTSVESEKIRRRDAELAKGAERRRRRELGLGPTAQDRLSGAFANIGAYGMVGAPLMHARQAVFSGIERQQSLKDTLAIGYKPSGNSGMYSDFGRLSQTVIKVAQDTGLAAEEVDKLALAIAQAGLAGDAAEKILTSMAKASRLSFGQLDPSVAIEGFNALKNTFYNDVVDPAKRAELAIKGVEDAIAIANSKASNPKQLIESFSRLGAAAKIAGFSAQETMLWLTKAGEAAGQSPLLMATALNRTMSRRFAPKTEEYIQDTMKISLRADDGTMKSTKDLYLEMAKVIGDLNKLGKDGADTIGRHMRELAGGVHGSRMQALLQVLPDVARELKELGDTQEENARKINLANDTLANSFLQLKNSAGQAFVGISEGSVVFDGVKLATDSLRQAIDYLGSDTGRVFDGMLVALTAFATSATPVLATITGALAGLWGAWKIKELGEEIYEWASETDKTGEIKKKYAKKYETERTKTLSIGAGHLGPDMTLMLSEKSSFREKLLAAESIAREQRDEDAGKRINSAIRFLRSGRKDPKMETNALKIVSEAVEIAASMRGNRADAMYPFTEEDSAIALGSLIKSYSAESRRLNSPKMISHLQEVEKTKFDAKSVQDLKTKIESNINYSKDLREEAAKGDPVDIKDIREQIKALKEIHGKFGKTGTPIEKTTFFSQGQVPDANPNEKKWFESARPDVMNEIKALISLEKQITGQGASAKRKDDRKKEKLDQEEEKRVKDYDKSSRISLGIFRANLERAYGKVSDNVFEQFDVKEIETFKMSTKLSRPGDLDLVDKAEEYIGSVNNAILDFGFPFLDTILPGIRESSENAVSDFSVKVFDSATSGFKEIIDSVARQGSLAMKHTQKMLPTMQHLLTAAGAGPAMSFPSMSLGIQSVGVHKDTMDQTVKIDKELEDKRNQELLLTQKEQEAWLKKISKGTDVIAGKSDVEKSFEGSIMGLLTGKVADWTGLQDLLMKGPREGFVNQIMKAGSGGNTVGGLVSMVDLAARFGGQSGATVDRINSGWVNQLRDSNQFGANVSSYALGLGGAPVGLSQGGTALGTSISGFVQTGLARDAMSKAATGSKLIGYKAGEAIAMLGDVAMIYTAVKTVQALADAVLGPTTNVRHDDRPVMEQQNERVSRVYGEMMSAARSGQYGISDTRKAYGYTPAYSTYSEETSSKSFVHDWFKKKDTHYYNNQEGLKSLSDMAQMQYDAILTAGAIELEYADKEVKMQRERLARLEEINRLEREKSGELTDIAKNEVEAMKLRKDLYDKAIQTGYEAIGTTSSGSAIRTITSKYDPKGIGTTGMIGGNIESSLLGRYFKGHGGSSVYGTTTGGGGFYQSGASAYTSYFKQAIKDAAYLSYDDGSLPYAIDAAMDPSTGHPDLRKLLAAGDTSYVLPELSTGGIKELMAALEKGPDGRMSVEDAIRTMLSELESFGVSSPIADELAEIIDIASDIVTLQKAMLEQQIAATQKSIESLDYLGQIESSNKSIKDTEKESNISYKAFVTRMSTGQLKSIGDESWEYRGNAINARVAAIGEYSGGAFGSDLLSKLYDTSYIESGLTAMSSSEPEKVAYVKNLISELSSAMSSMFGTYAGAGSAQGDEDSKIYEVGSSGKYYITQNFTVDSTYFGGSQADAVQFLKFLSRAWNESGASNTTQRLF